MRCRLFALFWVAVLFRVVWANSTPAKAEISCLMFFVCHCRLPHRQLETFVLGYTMALFWLLLGQVIAYFSLLTSLFGLVLPTVHNITPNNESQQRSPTPQPDTYNSPVVPPSLYVSWFGCLWVCFCFLWMLIFARSRVSSPVQAFAFVSRESHNCAPIQIHSGSIPSMNFYNAHVVFFSVSLFVLYYLSLKELLLGPSLWFCVVALILQAAIGKTRQVQRCYDSKSTI